MKTTALLRIAAGLALAGAAVLPAAAQSHPELLEELRVLRDRVSALEKKLQEREQAAAPAGGASGAAAGPGASGTAGTAGHWGMTPEQARELNRLASRTEALQDTLIDQGLKGLRIGGQIDPTWIWNRNLHNAGFVLLNRGGGRYTYDNGYFGMAVLDIEKETDGGSRWRLTLAPERGSGALVNDGSIVHEASVSIPLGDRETRLWLGQIPDWSSYETTLPAGNKLVTHNLPFDTMAPLAYTGALVDLRRGKWWTRIGLANLNAARHPVGTRRPVLIYRVDYAKREFAGFGFAGVHGKAANPADDAGYPDPANPGVRLPFADPARPTELHLLELDAFLVRGDLSLFGQLNVGQHKAAAIHHDDGVLRTARWAGLSGLLGYKFAPRLEGVARADLVRNRSNGGGLLGFGFDDPVNGIGRGRVDDGRGGGTFVSARGDSVGANRWALALGANYTFDENTLFKLELRLDGADQPVFAVFDGTGLKGFRRTNRLLGTSAVVRF